MSKNNPRINESDQKDIPRSTNIGKFCKLKGKTANKLRTEIYSERGAIY